MVEPKTMHWREKEAEFSIGWTDGHESRFPLPYLRKACPCAVCRGERANPDDFKMISSETPELKALAIEPVGNYAVQLQWNDGHTAGIYTFDFLRKLCPCASCQSPL